MIATLDQDNQAGVALAHRLGLKIIRQEGHDLVGPCIACKSGDAFRLHRESGVAYCYSCGSKWSPFQVAEVVLGNQDAAKTLMVELELFKPAANPAGQPMPTAPPNPIALIANAKGVSPESLCAFGAVALSPYTVRVPAYGPDGMQCTHFDLSIRGGKGRFATGKRAGLFFPHAHENGKVRLPQPGETWHLVEGCKDAAALHGLDLRACGLNTCRLAAKFARLFTGVDVILIPDRDAAGEVGAQHSAQALRGMAKSVRLAVLPAEFKDSDGEDVRDVLRRPGGRELVLQAITDAQPVRQARPVSAPDGQAVASTEIEMPAGDPLTLAVSPRFGKPQRLVIAKRGDVSHRDRIDTDSDTSRNRFIKCLAKKLGVEVNVLGPLVDPQITALADQVKEPNNGTRDHGDDEDLSTATLAVNLVVGWDLWHTPAGVAYATFPVGEHLETWAVRSRKFGQFLAGKFFKENEKAISSDALGSALNTIGAQALFDGDENSVHVRVAEHGDKIYFDLCNTEWQSVEISPDGWQVVDEAPVRFRRSAGMLPLPTPESGGSVDEIRDFLNVDDATWPLVVAWLVGALRPRGPYPVLALFGEHGSAKSMTGRLLRDLIDPNAAPLRAEPRDGHDLMIAANNSRILAYDNLSHIRPWLSDAICRLSTGGGFATRELYSDQDEVIFDSQRPLLLTSIEDVATRSDLLDRCMIVCLPAISENRRRPEKPMMNAFAEARPRILGALLDAVAGALRDLPSTKLDTLPRMADFALWATAAEASLGWPKGTFLSAYSTNRASANEVALEASPIARPLLELLDEKRGWLGTSSDLLQAVEAHTGDPVKRQRGWPANGRSMSGHLKRLSPNLRAVGWQVEFHRESSQRLWSIQRQDGFASPIAFASPGVRPTAVQTDATPRDLFHDDANDANDADDANAGTAMAASGRIGDDWEEGDL